MRQGFFALLTADPLRGALPPVEARLLEEARGEALFLVPYPLRDLAEAFDPLVAQAVADNPDLVGLGLLENTALRLLRGLGEVWAGEVTLVDAGGAEYTGRGVKGLRMDLLSARERFPLPAL